MIIHSWLLCGNIVFTERSDVVFSSQIMLQFLSIMIVSGVANYYIFIPMVFVILAFILLRWYYLRTSREVKRLEAVGKCSSWCVFTRLVAHHLNISCLIALLLKLLSIYS